MHEGVEDVVCFRDGDADVGWWTCLGWRASVAGDVRGPGAAGGARELRGVGVLKGHDFAGGSVVRVEHVVEQAADVCDFARGEFRSELGEGVGGVVYEGVDGVFGVLVAGGADFKLKGLEFGVDGLHGVGELGLCYVGC